jgi:hypothetical protein
LHQSQEGRDGATQEKLEALERQLPEQIQIGVEQNEIAVER